MPVDSASRDLVVNPGEYVYMQDTTKGQIKTHVGPTVVNQTGQDQPVVFDNVKFSKVSSLEQAVKRSAKAAEGEYIELLNPAKGSTHPQDAGVSNLPELMQGCKVNIPGPTMFALWPSQVANTIPGHNLRSNQYLVVRVYNEKEARENWGKAILKKQSEKPPATPPVTPPPAETAGQAAPDAAKAPDKPLAAAEMTTLNGANLDLSIGSRYIIPGVEVSFYIPPTGVEVVKDEKGEYVRDAVTLERLEYAILVDENGQKRYEKGPQVVFPKPTEEFWKDNHANRKFKAIELNPIQGLHIKVIAAYDEGGKKFVEGQEIFLTGKDCAIYYPRPEHSIISYGDRMKHFAVAVPAGEGRYVMDRNSGKIDTVKGSAMLLPNPISHVIVRRVLSDRQVGMWYPGNMEALAYNQSLRVMSATLEESAGTTGFVPEAAYATTVRACFLGDDGPEGARGPAGDDMSRVLKSFRAPMDAVSRGTKFTKPREITLDTKYDGVPVIQVWTGYAVMVVDKSGKRRVVVGPATILLNYDESLEILQLSTGKPKNTDRLLETVYLRVKNNKVSDIVEDVRTSDHVSLNIKLSFRVNFDGEATKWFEVENYVKFLTDHVRSCVKGAVRRIDIEKFYADGVAVLRDIILGAKPEKAERPGLKFSENGMHVLDVEVLDIHINDDKVRGIMEQAQFQVVAGNVGIAQAEKSMKIKLRQEEIARELDNAASATSKNKLRIQTEEVAENRKIAVARESAEMDARQKELEIVKVKESTRDLSHNSELGREKAHNALVLEMTTATQKLRLEELKAECAAVVERFKSVQGGFSEALLALSNQETLQKVAEALSVQRIIGGENVGDVLGNVFKNTQLEGILGRILEMSVAGKVVSPPAKQQ